MNVQDKIQKPPKAGKLCNLHPRVTPTPLWVTPAVWPQGFPPWQTPLPADQNKDVKKAIVGSPPPPPASSPSLKDDKTKALFRQSTVLHFWPLRPQNFRNGEKNNFTNSPCISKPTFI